MHTTVKANNGKRGKLKMKKSTKLSFITGFFFTLILFFSCNMSATSSTLYYSSMPYDAVGKVAYIQIVDIDDNYTTKELGKIKKETCSFNVRFPKNTVAFFAMIVDEYYDVDYYIGISAANGILDEYNLNGYWINTSEEKKEDGAWYTTSADYLEPLEFNNSVSLTFESRPFYMYEIKNVKDKQITVDFTGEEHTNIYVTTELKDILKQYGTIVNYNRTHYSFTPDKDTFYILIRPKKYGEWEKSKAEITVYDCTDLIKDTISFRKVLPLSDTELLVTADTGLYKYNVNETKFSLIKESDEPVVSAIPYKDGFFFGSRKDVYFYNKSTVEKWLTVSEDISGICATEDYLYVINGRGSQADVDIFDIITKDKIANESVYSAAEGTIVYIPENKNVYYIDSGITPTDIRFIYWNQTNTDVSDDDSPYHGDYSFKAPLLRYNTDMALIDGYGRIYSVEEDNHLKLIKETEIESDSILFDGSYLYALCTNEKENNCSVKKYLISNPEKDPVKVVTFPKEAGITLIKKGNSIQVVTKTTCFIYEENFTYKRYSKLVTREINLDLEVTSDNSRSVLLSKSVIPSYYNLVKNIPIFDLQE